MSRDIFSLKIGSKMTLGFLFMLILVIGLLTFFVITKNREIHFREEEISGLQHLQSVIHLVHALQEHRTMVQAALSDRTLFKKEIKQSEDRIQSILSASAWHRDTDGAPLDPLIVKEHASLELGWRDIALHWPTWTSRHSLDQHTRLIDGWTDHLYRVANRSNLVLDPTMRGYYFVDFLLNRLPKIAELVGRSHSLGMGIAVREEITLDEKRQLADYHAAIIYQCRQGRKAFQIAGKSIPAMKHRFDAIIQTCSDAVFPFLNSIQALSENPFALFPEDYFEVGNEAVETIFGVWDQMAPSLSEEIRKSVRQETEFLRDVLVVSAAVLLLLAIGALLFIRSITVPLRHAIEVLDHIGARRYDNVITVRGEDETGQLLHALELMQKRIKRYVAALVKMGEVRQEARAAREASRLKTAFLANMSHEIRTPMNGVLGLLELLRETSLNDEQRDFVGTAYHSATALLNILNDILDLSKIEAGQLQLEQVDFELPAVVEDVLAILDGDARRKGISLTVSFSDKIPIAVCGDPGRLRQILINLIGNAVKFTEKGGDVVLRVIHHGSLEDRPVLLRFEVEDTGIGMTPEALEKLFQPFQQADLSTTRRHGGTGLGLALCKQLVEKMRGRIGVRSEPGVGSMFWFEIPLNMTSHSLLSGKREASSREEPSSFAGRILLVEDDEINQKVALGMLKNSGLSVDVVHNGRQALERFKTDNAFNVYDLIFMDVHMPIMDGLDATRWIREEEQKRNVNPQIIIAMTASALKKDQENCFAAGMNDYISKPVTKKVLLALLARYLHQDPERAPEQKSASKPETASVTEDPIIDSEALKQIQEIMDEDFGNLLESYLSGVPLLLERIAISIQEHAPEELERAAHTLKSNSSSFGVTRLAAIALQLEACGRKKQWQGIDALLASARAAHLASEQELRTLCSA